MINPTSSLKSLGLLNTSTNQDRLESQQQEEYDLTEKEEIVDRDVREDNRKESSSILGNSVSSVNAERRQGSDSRSSSERQDTFKKSLKTAIHDKKSKSNSVLEDSQKLAGYGVSNQPYAPKLEDKATVNGVRSVDGSVPAVPILFDGQGQDTEELIDTSGEVSAVIKFMQSMENEFGVDPKKLIAAMSAAQAQIGQNPNQGLPIQLMGAQTQNTFFKELGLRGVEVRRAEFLYQTMLKEMAQDSMANYVKDSGKNVDVALLNPAQMRKQELGRSVDSMQKSFFMGEKPAYGKMEPFQQGQVKTSINGQADVTADKFSVDKGNQAAVTTSSGAAAAAGATVKGDTSPSIDFWKQPIATQAVATAGSEVAATTTKLSGAADSSGKIAAAQSAGQEAGWLGGLAGASIQSVDGFSKSSEDSSGSESGMSADSGKSETSVSTGRAKEADSFAVQLNGAKIESLSGAVASTAPAAVDRPEDVMNVRNLIQGAQVLLRQGGGEMKVQMHPEGLGQVDLKVMVSDGKVDVQILAETADTKRLLEKNINDLRASLSGQKLEISDLKVDMSKSPEREANNDNNRDFNREQARQFLGQFRDEREAMRNGMFELPSMRQYKQSKAKELQPVDSAGEAKPAAKNSSRLNVVV